MRKFPTEFRVCAPRQDVEKSFGLGARVRLNKDFIYYYSGIFKAKTAHLENTDWEVLNYYYVVGSRRKEIGMVVVGVPYSDWKTLAPQINLVPSHSYGGLPRKIVASCDEEGHKIYDLLLDDPNDMKVILKKKLCVMILTHWNNGWYDGIEVPDIIAEGPAGDMF